MDMVGYIVYYISYKRGGVQSKIQTQESEVQTQTSKLHKPPVIIISRSEFLPRKVLPAFFQRYASPRNRLGIERLPHVAPATLGGCRSRFTIVRKDLPVCILTGPIIKTWKPWKSRYKMQVQVLNTKGVVTLSSL